MGSCIERHYVQDLKTWDLPRLEDLEERVVEEFGPKARVVFLEGERSGGQLRVLFLDRLRELAGAAVNETLEYWLKGLVNGCNGQFPQLCVELPFLERREGERGSPRARLLRRQRGWLPHGAQPGDTQRSPRADSRRRRLLTRRLGSPPSYGG